MNTKKIIRAAAVPLVVASTLSLAACGKSIEDTKQDAVAKIDSLTWVNESEVADYQSRIEQAGDTAAVEMVTSEATQLDSQRTSAVEPILAVVSDKRLSFQPPTEEYIAPGVRAWTLPGGTSCTIELRSDQSLGQGTTFWGPECADRPTAPTRWTFVFDRAEAEDPTLEFQDEQGELVYELTDIKPSADGTGIKSFTSSGDTAEFGSEPLG